MCFTDPCWIAEGVIVAGGWREKMLNFQYDASVDPTVRFDLQNYEHVKGWVSFLFGACCLVHIDTKTMTFC